MGGFSSRRGCCCCRGIVRFLFLLRRLLRLLLLVRVGRHESGTGPQRSWFASFFFAPRPTVQAKRAIRAGKGLFVYGAKKTDCLASPPSSQRLRTSLRVQSLRCRLRNKARNRQTMISCLDLYRAGFRVGPGLSFSLSLLVAALLSPLARRRGGPASSAAAAAAVAGHGEGGEGQREREERGLRPRHGRCACVTRLTPAEETCLS